MVSEGMRELNFPDQRLFRLGVSNRSVPSYYPECSAYSLLILHLHVRRAQLTQSNYEISILASYSLLWADESRIQMSFEMAIDSLLNDYV